MARHWSFLMLVQWLLIFSVNSIHTEKKDKYLKSLITYLNNLPNALFNYEDGFLLNIQDAGKGDEIEAIIKARELYNRTSVKVFKCQALVSYENDHVSVNQHRCHEVEEKVSHATESELQSKLTQVAEPQFVLEVKPENEVLDNNTLGGYWVVGGLIEQDPSDVKYMVLAEKSLMKFQTQLSNSKDIHKIVSINKVTTQVVSGVITRIDFDISPILDSSVVMHCHSEIWNKPWLPDSEQITVKCSEGSRSKRDASVGGLIKQDPSDSKYMVLAEKSLMKFQTQLSNSKDIHKIVSINKVTTQVVSGVITRIDFDISPILDSSVVMHCHSEIWNRPWLPDSEQITVKCSEGSRSKRDASVGGLTEQDPSDVKYMVLAEKSLMKFQTQLSNSKDIHKIVSINKVTTQVVSGVITRIDFIISSILDSSVVMHCHSEIWNRPWLPDSEQITVKCSEGSRSKRDASVGGLTEQDPSDSKYMVLAEKSLMKFQTQLSNSKDIHKIVSINKVTTQVVSGVITRIDFDISPILDSSVVMHCHSEIWNRPWLPDSEQITVKCSEGSRSKRDASVGGLTKQDPSDSKYMVLAEKSLMKFQTQLSNSKDIHKIVSINKVTTQVVSGVITRIDFIISSILDSSVVMHCHSEIWNRPWLPDSEQITVKCSEGSRSKRDASVGGLTEQDPSDSKYMVLAEKSLMKFQTQLSNSKDIHKIVSINKVTTQVVSGVITRIDFDISPILDSSVVMHCHSEIWNRPWLPDSEQITVKCSEGSRSKRDASVGGLTKQDPSDSKYMVLAEKSLMKFQTQLSNSKDIHKIVSINKVTTQVVSGVITRIDFDISPILDSSVVMHCHSEIWNKPWLPDSEQITVKCSEGSRSKRDASVGGLTKQDPSDSKYMVLAEKSLMKFQTQLSNSKDIHKIVSINKVTTQIVAGVLTRIDFDISPILDSSVVMHCHSEIWNKPWLPDSEQITVKCSEGSRSKRDASVGGLTEQDPSDVKYMVLAEKSLMKFQTQLSNSKDIHKIVSINKVTTQIVAGVLTRIDFDISPISDSSVVMHCHSEIWNKPWLPDSEQITVKCSEGSRSKRDVVVGGLTEQDPSDSKYMVLAEKSLMKFQTQLSNSKDIHKIVSINKVATQIVAGVLTRIGFDISPILDSSVVMHCHSEIWNKPWLPDSEQITVKCSEGSRSKRDVVVGGLTERDPSDVKYMVLAEKSLMKFQTQLSNSKDIHKIVSINKVTTQIVAGVLTRIDFDISPILDSSVVMHCHSEIWNKPWLPDSEQITVKCSEGSRSKRDVVVGGLTERDPSDVKYMVLAEKSLMKFQTQLSNSKDIHKIVSINKVTTQIVSGVLTRIDFHISPILDSSVVMHCHSEIWYRPWLLDSEEITGKCSEGSRMKRASNLGAPVEQDPSKKEFNDLAKKSLKLFYETSDLEYLPKVVNISKVTIQSASGTITRIDFYIAPTICSKKDMRIPAGEDCLLNGDVPEVYGCHSEIWSKAWLPHGEEMTIKCNHDDAHSAHESSQIFDSQIDINLLAEEALTKYEVMSKSKYAFKITKFNEIVSGNITRFTFMITPTTCLLKDIVNLSRSKCDIQVPTLERICRVEIWKTTWLIKDKKDITISCDLNVFIEGINKDPREVYTTDIDDRFLHDNEKLNNHIIFTKNTTKALYIEYKPPENYSKEAELAEGLSNEILKHAEAKYPYLYKQKVLRVLSLRKHRISEERYKVEFEVGYTNCSALTLRKDCEVIDTDLKILCKGDVTLAHDSLRVTHVFCEEKEHNTDIYVHIQADYLFREFVTTYRPSYKDDRVAMANRYKIFKDNVKKMHQFNTLETGTATYGVTKFSDLTYEEFSKNYMGLNMNLKNENEVPMLPSLIPDTDVLDKFDWRDQGVVTEVKNQGSCGSCWAFSVTGNIEGQWKLKKGELISLSEQELVDCDKVDQGCNGGLPDYAYRAIEELGGLETESDYPYEAVNDKCMFNKTMTKVQISGAVNITSNEVDMAKWLTKNGPISIGINANAMQFYMGGVSHPWQMLCNPEKLDHAVLIVGYGTEEHAVFKKNLPYWTIKNSWGKSWGEQGYYRVYRGDSTCGVNKMASSAVV